MASIYVGNLPYTSSEDDIRQLFEQHGAVHSVKLVMDRVTGRPRGFGFVEMEKSSAEAAISELNGNEMGGRTLKINQAFRRPPNAPAHDD